MSDELGVCAAQLKIFLQILEDEIGEERTEELEERIIEMDVDATIESEAFGDCRTEHVTQKRWRLM